MKNICSSWKLTRLICPATLIMALGCGLLIAPSQPLRVKAISEMERRGSELVSVMHNDSELDVEKGKGSMNTEPMTPDEILDMLKRLKNYGYLMGDIPSDHSEAKNLAISLRDKMLSQANQNETNSVPGEESGRQDLILKLNPGTPFDSAHDRHLGIFLDGPEWSAIFYDVLGYEGEEPFVAGANIDEWTERHRLEFQRKIPQYPMLGRIWDTYINVSYQSDEIIHLRDECLAVKALAASTPKALQGLDKLISACEEARRAGTGLYLACD